MNKAVLAIGIVAVAIPFYDEVALQVGSAEGQQVLPFIWKGSVANAIPELWLAIGGALLILLAAFVNLG